MVPGETLMKLGRELQSKSVFVVFILTLLRRSGDAEADRETILDRRSAGNSGQSEPEQSQDEDDEYGL